MNALLNCNLCTVHKVKSSHRLFHSTSYHNCLCVKTDVLIKNIFGFLPLHLLIPSKLQAASTDITCTPYAALQLERDYYQNLVGFLERTKPQMAFNTGSQRHFKPPFPSTMTEGVLYDRQQIATQPNCPIHICANLAISTCKISTVLEGAELYFCSSCA